MIVTSSRNILLTSQYDIGCGKCQPFHLFIYLNFQFRYDYWNSYKRFQLKHEFYFQEAAHHHQLVVTEMDFEGEVRHQKEVRQVALSMGVLEVEAVDPHRAKLIVHHHGVLGVRVANHHAVMAMDSQQAAVAV